MELLLNIATLAGVLFGAWQLKISKESQVAEYEARFVERYEVILARFPDEFVIGRSELGDVDATLLRAFYSYFMLCDEQIASRQAGRIDSRTWVSWREGIGLNLRRPTFEKAWDELSDVVRDDRLSHLCEWRDGLAALQDVDPRPGLIRRIGSGQL